jgi:hypothetical protein
MHRMATGRRGGAPKGHPKWGGRAKGTKNHQNGWKAHQRQRLIQQLIDQILDPEHAEQLDPMIVVRTVMRAKLSAGDLDGAAALALQCMPYVHAKLVSAQINVRNELAVISDEELTRRITAERRQLAGRMLELTGPGRVIEVEAEPPQNGADPGIDNH